MKHEEEKDEEIKNPGNSSSTGTKTIRTNLDINPQKSTADSSSTSSTTNDTRACAACKYQRRRCAPDCPLASYFPPDHQKQFLNAHKLFGLRNMMKVYKRVQQNERDLAMRSMIFESNMRARDPVGGCFRHIEGLHKKIQLYKTELSFVLNQLALLQNLNNDSSNSAAATPAASAPTGGSEKPSGGAVNPSTGSMMVECTVPPQSMRFQPDPDDEFGALYADFYLQSTIDDDGVIQTITCREEEPLMLDGSEEDMKGFIIQSEKIKPDPSRDI